MSFNESPRFPEDIGFGAVGGPTFITRISVSQSGHEQRRAQWSIARMRYNVSHAVNTQQQIEELVAFFRAMQGRAHGFRFKDWMDFEVTTDSGRFNLGGVGEGLPTGQLQKYYESGSLTALRPITKPVSLSTPSSTVALHYNSTSGSPAADIDFTTGVVTFSAFASAAVDSLTTGAFTDVTLVGALSPDLAVGEKLYVTSLFGDVGSYMNGIAHTITSHTGAIYTVATDTSTPALVYSGGGTGYHYPQETNTLRWSGAFDVPVRFDSDAMKVTLDAGYFKLWSEIELVEIKVSSGA